jgi:hypothetical protein
MTDAELLVASGLLVLGGLCALAAGVYLRRSGDVVLVAGVRREAVTDEAGLARLVGTYTAGVGAATVLLGVAYPLLQAATRSLATALYLVAVFVALVPVWRRRGRYTE